MLLNAHRVISLISQYQAVLAKNFSLPAHLLAPLAVDVGKTRTQLKSAMWVVQMTTKTVLHAIYIMEAYVGAYRW